MSLLSRYNLSGSGSISLQELKIMMEKLGAPQTHLGLKAMIKEVDEDDDFAISFREFLMIFRKARAGELDLESGLSCSQLPAVSKSYSDCLYVDSLAQSGLQVLAFCAKKRAKNTQTKKMVRRCKK